MEIDKQINDLIIITKRLIEILEKENKILQNHEHFHVNEYLDDKTNISRIYETKYQALIDGSNSFKNLTDDQKSALKRISDEVNEIVEKNGLLLNVAIEANKNVVALIAEAVKEASQKTETYGASGTNSVSAARAESQSNAFSIDQTL